MTQMMLFDHQSLATPTLTPPASRPSAKPSPDEAGAPLSPANRTAETPRVPARDDDGIHRMGDLARLVLLRYQLVAKRREAMAAR